jgi:predicted transcriptional regulator
MGSYRAPYYAFSEVMYVPKNCWISVKVSERVAKIVKTVASAMGVSVSELTRQALLEKLERMNIVGSEVKAVLFQEAGKDG